MRHYYLDSITKTIFVLNTKEDRQGLTFIGSSQNPKHQMAASRMLPGQSGFTFRFSFSVMSESDYSTT